MNPELKAWIKDIAVAVIVALLITRFVSPTIVKEHSMLNTLNENDYLILWKAAYFFDNEPEYGDIIVFKSDLTNYDTGKKKLLIKRVIGLPGDVINIADGVVYRNGEALYEPYTRDGVTNDPEDMTKDVLVEDGKMFVMGDNRLESVDSRRADVGLVEMDRLVGKAVFRLYPFSDIGGLYKDYPGN